MNRKRILSAILLAAMLFSLWGCKKDADKSEKKKTTSESGQETPSETGVVCLLNQKVVEGGETVRYSYDERGFLVAETCDSNEIRYIYDAARRLTLKECYQGGQCLWRQQWTYDDQGNLNAVIRWEKETEVYREVYAYENGRLTEKTVKDNGETYHLWYRYDENGRLQAAYEAQNGDRLRATYTYNEKGQLIEESWFSDTEHIMRILRTYYTDGTLCKEEYRSPIRNIWTCEEFLYNERGQLTMHLVYDRAAEVERQEYLFDENGNLSGEIHYKNGQKVYRAKYDCRETELPAEDVAEAALRNEAHWMEPAIQPGISVFAFPFRVVK